MKLSGLRRFFSSPTGRLAESYLLVMMLVSIGFSLIFYNVSSYQLGRQLPPDHLTKQVGGQVGGSQPPAGYHDTDDIGQFLHDRIDQGRVSLRYRLLYLNAGALAVGCVLSYYLARRTLRPIEQSMESQAHFINDASHELRTPLAAITASNEVAMRNPKLTLAEARQVIEQNTQDAQRLRMLSDGLLDLARTGQTELTYAAVELQDVVGTAMTQIIPQASAKAIIVRDEVANIRVLGNQNALVQVLVILLDNAVKYSELKRTVRLRTRIKGKQVFLDVIDQGIGIRASDVPHLFRRFYRADHSRSAGDRSGYGLGLAIADSIIKSHGGSITVVSKVGEGSTFTLRLKLAEPPVFKPARPA